MAKITNLAKDTLVRNIIQEYVASQAPKQILSEVYSNIDKKSNTYSAIQLGEQLAYDIQVDVVCEYLNEHPVLKEDIFQRGLAKTKAWLTTPLGKGFGQAKDTQVIQNLFGALKKNTDRIVSAGPSPFAPSEEDAKNNPTQIGQIGALIGKRFAALQNNPKLNAPATPEEQQAGMGRIEGLISKIRSSGMVKGLDNMLDEVAVFARQHPVLTNMIVAGLVAVLTMTTGGGLFGVPLLGKFLIGTALRTLVGMLKGEKATQAAAKGALVSGAGILVGKLLGLFYDKIAGWLAGQADGSALPVPPQPVPTPSPVPGVADIDTSHLGQEEYLSSYRGMLFNKAVNAASSEEFQTYLQQIQNADAQYGFNGELPEWDPANAAAQLPVGAPPAAPVPAPVPAPIPPGGTLPPEPPPVTPVDIQPTLADLRPKLDSLARLASSTDIKGATAPAARQAMQNWVAGISQPEAKAMLADPNVYNQLMRKGALGALKSKFGLQESELDLIKAELIGGAIALTEANPFTAAKNFMTGGPEVGGKNARLDYKQVESDYLKFLNNMESSLGLKTEKDILDTLKKYDKSFPGVYDYVMKVRNWLYGATPVANKPQPEAVVVPPEEVPTPTNPEPSPTNPTKPEDNPNKPEPTAPVAPTPGPGGGYSNKNLAKYLTALKGSPLFAGNLQQRVVGMLKAADNPNSPEAKAGMATLKTFLINFSKAISEASAQYRQKVGDPNAVRKEVESNPAFATLAEAAADLLAQNKERQAFLTEFNAAVPNIVGATVELRQIFNKNNPNSVYNFKAQPEQPAQPPKLPMPAQKPGLKIAPPVIGGGLPAGFAPKVTEDLETRGKAAATNPGASGNLTAPDIANARAMFAKLIDLGPILQKVNPNSLDKASLKQLIITFLDIGDVLVYKKGSKKTNKAVDAALQGLDILGPGGAGAPQAQQGGFTPKEKTLITLRVPPTLEDTGGLLPKALYQYYGGKWNVVTAKGLQPLDTKNMAKQIAKLTALAKAGRNDYDKAIELMKTNAKDKGAGIDFAVGNQVKEYFKLKDYKKFFI